MIELSTGAADTLEVHATGKLHRSDYRNVLVPAIRSMLGRFKTIRVLFVLGDGFEGWSPGAAWANTILDLGHRRDFERVAVVGAPRWERWCVNFAASPLMKGAVRTFGRGELADARRWLQS